MSTTKDEPSKPRYARTKSGVSVRIIPRIELSDDNAENARRIMKWEEDSAEQVIGSRSSR
jgi:hypothetical protein